MKKVLFIIAAMFITQLAQAKDYVIVVKGTDIRVLGKTVVGAEKDSGIDTLIISPAKDVESIYINLRDNNGNIVESYCSSANYEDSFTILSSCLPNGYVLEIRDDKGMVYREEE